MSLLLEAFELHAVALGDDATRSVSVRPRTVRAEEVRMADPRCLAKFEVADSYSTGDDALLDEFLVPALSRSRTYDRAVGFFSSSLVALMPTAVAEFVQTGGKMRLVCSPHLSEIDLRWLGLDANADPESGDVVVAQIAALAEADDLAAALVTAMSSLVDAGALEVKFARPAFGSGIFHDKVGIFADSCSHRLSFVGSANETAAAWSGLANHEQIETFGSWLSDEQERRSSRHSQHFEELWLGVRRGVRVSSTEDTRGVLLKVSQPEVVEVALDRVREIIKERSRRSGGGTPSKRRALRAHQMSVLDDWREHGRIGIVVFATGGGKTLTGLAAAEDWMKAGRPVVIAVPSVLLLRQWMEEAKLELPDVPLLVVGGGEPRSTWERNLSLFTADDPSLGPRLTLTTYDTAVSDDFLRLVSEGEHLMLVADEVHRVGAPDRRRLLDVDTGARMGLSATPERFGDPEGTAAIFDYFGERLEPEFGLSQAIKAGQLVPYDYDFVTVALTSDEQESWDEISAQMAKEMARNDGQATEWYRRLALKRSRIMKAASNKASVAKRILDERQKPGDRWLIYCESREHLKAVRQLIETPNRRVLEYHSGNSDLAKEIFQCFEEGGVLLAIKCLDEGVDLPFINKALILASTTNPREYIQRRGRVLRWADGKYSAEVIDVLVVDPDGYPLVTSEASRAVEFAENASNASGRLRLELLLKHAMRVDLWRRDETSVESEGE